jgi:hypothetical protein
LIDIKNTWLWLKCRSPEFWGIIIGAIIIGAMLYFDIDMPFVVLFWR